MNQPGIGFFANGLYDKHRKGYTDKFIPELESSFPEKQPLAFAEFGAGSGAFTKILVDSAVVFNELYIVDPDGEGLSQHKEKFRNNKFYNKFIYISGSAEKSCLDDNSIDVIMTAQAFHWFDLEKTGIEWRRITKPSAKVFIVGRFNMPLNAATEEFIALTRFGKRLHGYKENIEAYSPQNLSLFFGHPVERKVVCRESESKTYDELMGEMAIRINASGSTEVVGQSGEIMEKARVFFEKRQINNRIELVTESFYVCDTFS